MARKVASTGPVPTPGETYSWPFGPTRRAVAVGMPGRPQEICNSVSVKISVGARISWFASAWRSASVMSFF